METLAKSKNLYIALGGAIALILITIFLLFRDSAKAINLTQLNSLIKNEQIRELNLNEPYLYITTKDRLFKIPSKVVDLKSLALKYPIDIKRDMVGIVIWLIALLSLGVVVTLLFRQRASKTIELKAKDELINQKEIYPINSDITFSDIAGAKEVKEDLKELIDFLKNPKKYRELGIRLPKGVLLVGEPGVGKTYLAKALAGEAKVPFFYQSGANIVEIYVGMGAKRVHELFLEAKKMAPSIIFIDEIDAIGKSRGKFANEEREATLNQLLTEMDGFESSSGVIVIGATNKIEVLDSALLRPGRFDRRIFIPLPDFSERLEILKLYLKDKPHLVDIEKIAKYSVGFSASALATLVNESALHALRSKRDKILNEDFEAVKEQVISGKRKILTFSPKEREIQALYQGAKALVATWLDIPYQRIGIVTTQFEEVEREILSKSDILNEVKVYLAGSVALKLRFNQQFSNSSNDIARAWQRCREVIEKYYMGESILPNESEINTLFKDCYLESEELIKSLNRALIKIESYLLANENITPKEAKRIIDEIL